MDPAMRSGLRYQVCMTALLIVGCSQGHSTTGVVARDSVIDFRGEPVTVLVVDNPEHSPSVWQLAAEPRIDVNGEGSGSTPYFGIVRVARLSDDRILVADAGSMTLRILGPDGVEGASIGGPGEGPGEFRSFTHVGKLPGDTVVVADLVVARVSVFDAEGELVREVRWGNAANSPGSAIVGTFEGGTFLARGFTQLGYPPPHGLRRHPVVFYHLDGVGILADTIGEFLGSETYYLPTERGFRANPGLFAQSLSFASAGQEFYVGTSDTYEIRVLASSGKPLRIVRRAVTPSGVSAEDVAAEKRSRLEGLAANDIRASLERMLAEMPVPEQMPAFDRILVDEERNLWVREYSPAWREERDLWTIFDPAGQIVGELAMPLGFEPHQIGADYVIGVSKDAFDVERVRLYDLLKPS